jgi:hypothetical protein
MDREARLDRQFTSVLRKSRDKGGWTYPVRPESVACFGTRGLGQGHRDGGRPPLPEFVHGARRRHHKLPVKADVRRAIGKEAGDTVTVHLTERLTGH